MDDRRAHKLQSRKFARGREGTAGDGRLFAREKERGRFMIFLRDRRQGFSRRLQFYQTCRQQRVSDPGGRLQVGERETAAARV